LFERHAQVHPITVGEDEFVALLAGLDAQKARNAVFVVHDEVAFLHFIDVGAGAAGTGFFQCAAARHAWRAVAAEEFGG